ncbi:MAG: putative Zinc finger protein [Streblomastix strix]|uniref:Putative Zinc finger protein n=1 Tax=Streblomastix strix TaxID=222440 RepID=A0A5J4WX66_9EUKA|nr:MAG: putative Zinc finger protein [Streblomastix strix]
MGRRKRIKGLNKPFCWYCNRDFDNLKVLVDHQKAKHFKCSTCNRRFNSAPAMIAHARTVHKDIIPHVPNSLPGYDIVTIDIYGMEGVPEDDIKAHKDELYRQIKQRRRQKESDSDDSEEEQRVRARNRQKEQGDRNQDDQFQQDKQLLPAVISTLHPGATGGGNLPMMIQIQLQQQNTGPIQPAQLGFAVVPPQRQTPQIAQNTASIVYRYTDNTEQMEEKRARARRYQFRGYGLKNITNLGAKVDPTLGYRLNDVF